ncbi:hypothetical protein RHMOL_Rhmol04G0164700 [Rhododendron molle]|uniref:Uncharacterized protein n=1 Tax=Rhododendron molle TaxID=49168 RepID=A0ACC0P2Z2_RHOML|nr:hypothetical protein RHMOL_Rhmol04G0164700 [Rhododendron molle]
MGGRPPLATALSATMLIGDVVMGGLTGGGRQQRGDGRSPLQSGMGFWEVVAANWNRGGMESNSSNGTTGGPVRIQLCEHIEQAVLHTSWTDKNPSRKFFGCPYWYPGAPKTGRAHCDYFEWLDGPIGEQENVVLRS